jgi:hypothetical protein
MEASALLVWLSVIVGLCKPLAALTEQCGKSHRYLYDSSIALSLTGWILTTNCLMTTVKLGPDSVSAAASGELISTASMDALGILQLLSNCESLMTKELSDRVNAWRDEVKRRSVSVDELLYGHHGLLQIEPSKLFPACLHSMEDIFGPFKGAQTAQERKEAFSKLSDYVVECIGESVADYDPVLESSAAILEIQSLKTRLDELSIQVQRLLAASAPKTTDDEQKSNSKKKAPEKKVDAKPPLEKAELEDEPLAAPAAAPDTKPKPKAGSAKGRLVKKDISHTK